MKNGTLKKGFIQKFKKQILIILITLAVILLVKILSGFLVKNESDNLQKKIASENIAKGIINTFIADNHLPIKENTSSYREFLKGVLLGDYPELTGEDSEYIDGQEDLNRLLEYMTKQTSSIYKDYPIESEVKEVIPINVSD